ncbi:MAG: hypothetical protein FJX80_11790 [Bacteroidetes bacterium]|nr:hypothetical protein [Bacteroidota bacterium]
MTKKNTHTKWIPWNLRHMISKKDQPAIYYIANSKVNITDNDFSYIKEIVYIGMTISNKGLKGRLDQFEKTMKGSDGAHGGAERVRFKHKDADDFFKNTYVSACIFELSKEKNTSNDWRIKGDCVGYEYKSFAEYLDNHNKLPEFNDIKKSKKK